ncbi:unnamed protein product [Phytomonas sp. Hart1]|nr:unnamed protein product [Phytomonas sp. Hart1]|eukprot:CCW70919.1 unnamed protein product [Phytomonas sp. isolate Hart1]
MFLSPFCTRRGCLGNSCTRVTTLVSIIILGFLLSESFCSLASGESQRTEIDDSNPNQDFYAILGLEKERDEATESAIKAAWRRLSKKYHPDVSGEANRKVYQRIQRAYEVLGDRRKRKVYDILGIESVLKLEQPQPQQPQHPFFHLFGGHTASDRGRNLSLVLDVPLRDAYTGAEHRVVFQKTKLCRACRGTGARSPSDIVACPMCQGSGSVVRRVQFAPGFIQQMQHACPRCEGKGKRITARCTACDGRRVVESDVAIAVSVEAGAPEGLELVYELEADQEPGRVPGDVVVTIVTAEHPLFERRGNDLHAKITLSLREALLGFERVLQHLDQHEVLLKETGIVEHGRRFVIKGEGMPRHHVPSERGDLYVTYLVSLPEHLTHAQREALKLLN